MAISKELVAASATPLILSILSEEESYGYAIIKRVRELSGDQMQWTDGMLYPILHRLEKQGLIRARWGQTENGRKRKYYRIEKAGTKILEAQQNQWQVVYTTLAQLWGKSCLT
ncbi:PadR family transcriptional regulator [Planctomycetota bacterium]